MFGIVGQMAIWYPYEGTNPSETTYYVAEDGTTYYVAEDGVTYYVTESSP